MRKDRIGTKEFCSEDVFIGYEQGMATYDVSHWNDIGKGDKNTIVFDARKTHKINYNPADVARWSKASR